MATQVEYDLGNGLLKIIKPTKINMNFEISANNKVKISSSEIITLNGENISSTDSEVISRSCAEVMGQTVTVTDPETQQQVTVSMSGIHEALSQFFVNWYNAARPE